MNLVTVQRALRVVLAVIVGLMVAWTAWMGLLNLLTGREWR